MNTYTNTTFDGLWPVGTSAVVTAESPEEAALLLNEALIKTSYLPQDEPVEAKDMLPLEPGVTILQDGNY